MLLRIETGNHLRFFADLGVKGAALAALGDMVVLLEPEVPLAAVVRGVKEGESTLNVRCLIFSFDACDKFEISFEGSWT